MRIWSNARANCVDLWYRSPKVRPSTLQWQIFDSCGGLQIVYSDDEPMHNFWRSVMIAQLGHDWISMKSFTGNRIILTRPHTSNAYAPQEATVLSACHSMQHELIAQPVWQLTKYFAVVVMVPSTSAK